MKFFSVPAAVALVSSLVSAQECTAPKRVDIAKNITAAFNEPNYAKSAAGINAMPLTADCPAIVYVDGAPGIEFGFDSTSTKNFANVVRQVFVHVQSTYHDYGNGTLIMDAIVTLGVAHYVPLPVYAHIIVPIEFDYNTCLISKLPAYVFVPVDVGGRPINPPIIPAIPGIATIPGFREILQQLAAEGIIPGQKSPNPLLARSFYE